MSKDFFKQFVNEFEGLEKGELDELVNENIYHIVKVRFIDGDNGEYAQFIVDEIPGKFFNASNPISATLIACRDANVIDELPDVGWRFKEGVSRQWNTKYIAMSAAEI